MLAMRGERGNYRELQRAVEAKVLKLDPVLNAGYGPSESRLTWSCEHSAHSRRGGYRS